MDNLFPSLRNLVQQVTLLVACLDDNLIGKVSANGDLSMKDAYDFKRKLFPIKSWAKSIWNKDIPPSKSLLAWRLMHGKFPTDDMFMARGCNIASMCSVCRSTSESSLHLFFECNFAYSIWYWLATILNPTLQFQSLEDIWNLCERSWSPQCKVTILSAI
jgi:hypothetical protein